MEVILGGCASVFTQMSLPGENASIYTPLRMLLNMYVHKHMYACAHIRIVLDNDGTNRRQAFSTSDGESTRQMCKH
jgi:hypothetical protein